MPDPDTEDTAFDGVPCDRAHQICQHDGRDSTVSCLAVGISGAEIGFLSGKCIRYSQCDHDTVRTGQRVRFEEIRVLFHPQVSSVRAWQMPSGSMPFNACPDACIR